MPFVVRGKDKRPGAVEERGQLRVWHGVVPPHAPSEIAEPAAEHVPQRPVADQGERHIQRPDRFQQAVEVLLRRQPAHENQVALRRPAGLGTKPLGVHVVRNHSDATADSGDPTSQLVSHRRGGDYHGPGIAEDLLFDPASAASLGLAAGAACIVGPQVAAPGDQRLAPLRAARKASSPPSVWFVLIASHSASARQCSQGSHRSYRAGASCQRLQRMRMPGIRRAYFRSSRPPYVTNRTSAPRSWSRR